jgi:hypothetical protein
VRGKRKEIRERGDKKIDGVKKFWERNLADEKFWRYLEGKRGECLKDKF